MTGGSPGSSASSGDTPPSAPPLRPFGLVLRHDGRFLHEGQPILNRRLRERFERSVEYQVEEREYIVRLGYFRGRIEVQEAAFFVRSIDLDSGELGLSDGSREQLEVATLTGSAFDGALLCRVKRALEPDGLLARFMPSAHAELMLAVESEGGSFFLSLGGERQALPLPALEGPDPDPSAPLLGDRSGTADGHSD